MSDQPGPRQAAPGLLSPATLLTLAVPLIGIISTAAIAHHRLAAAELRLEKLEHRAEIDQRDRQELRLSTSTALADLNRATNGLHDAVRELRDTIRTLPDRRRQ